MCGMLSHCTEDGKQNFEYISIHFSSLYLILLFFQAGSHYNQMETKYLCHNMVNNNQVSSTWDNILIIRLKNKNLLVLKQIKLKNKSASEPKAPFPLSTTTSTGYALQYIKPPLLKEVNQSLIQRRSYTRHAIALQFEHRIVLQNTMKHGKSSPRILVLPRLPAPLLAFQHARQLHYAHS